MPFTGIADQHDIDIMTEALAAYCRERDIANEEDRTFAAERIAALFFSGERRRTRFSRPCGHVIEVAIPESGRRPDWLGRRDETGLAS
ncbi:MAG: hypothetical protein KF694_12670 [Mesorhizobium sp.]|nr:hypothetical protein [Mesorhizobium sp.]